MLNRAMYRWLYFGKVRASYYIHCGVCVKVSVNLRNLGERNISNGEKYLSPSNYDNMIEKRRNQSRKSLIVELSSKDSGPTLCNFCEQYGKISEAFQYKLGSKKAAVLIQYEKEDSTKLLLQNCSHRENVNIPTQTRLLKFPSKTHWLKKNQISSEVKLNVQDDSNINLFDCKSVSEQLKLLHEKERINDLEIRLRFMVCQQIEDALSGLFPSCRVLPFGSTVNGFGRNSSDLDMVLELGQTKTSENETDDNRESLYFQNGKHVSYARGSVQMVLETVGDLMKAFFPSTSQIHKILNARVPIVKFHHDLTNIDCDLSFGNLSGFYMSELIHLFGQIDDRLYPLVFTIRKWAYAKKVTQILAPGPWISNFSLSLLVIFFLQRKSILPTVQFLRENAGKDDFRETDDINCTFLRDSSKIHVTNNNEDLEELLIEFFKFYETFDFRDHAISIVNGKEYDKTQNNPLHIENPLEPELNVSKNVSTHEIERFKTAVKEALQLMNERNSPSKKKNWGVLNLFANDETKTAYQSIQMKDLFDPKVGQVLKEMPVIIPVINLKRKQPTQLNLKVPSLKKSPVSSTTAVVPEISRKRGNNPARKRKEWLGKIFDKW